MLERLREIYDSVQQTLIEGNYRSEHPSIWSRIFGEGKNKLPETAEIAVAATMIGTSRTWGTRMMWASAIALLSMKFMAWTAAGLAVLGAGLIANEYVQCRRAQKEVIEEINFAGQRVRGTRSDLCRLHMAQVRIMNLGNAFKPASLESTSDTIQDIIDSVREETKRVKVLDTGRYNADANVYDFSEPGIKLVNDKQNPEHVIRSTAASVPSLKEAFDGKRLSEEEIVERLAALESALPASMQQKLMQRRAQPGA